MDDRSVMNWVYWLTNRPIYVYMCFEYPIYSSIGNRFSRCARAPSLRANVDVCGLLLDWFWQTFLVGRVDEEGVGLVETAFRCLAAAVYMVQPGAMYRDLGGSISKIARERGVCVCVCVFVLYCRYF